MKPKVLDDIGNIKRITLHNTIHVPTLKIRLISIQQLAQQNKDPQAGGHILAEHLLLKWDGNIKTVKYNTNSNLPIIATAPGGARAAAFISKHSHKYAFKNATKVAFDNNTLLQINKKVTSPELIDKDGYEPDISSQSILKQHSNKPSTKQRRRLTSLSLCQECEKPTLSDATQT